MNELPTKLKARADKKSAKRDEKKRVIAQSAIQALKELGFANTSLRDIAAQSDLSLGMLHYYFEDRSDLIIFCTELYKEQFVRDINAAIEKAEGREQVIDAFSKALVHSIIDDGMIHRIWYDIRTQAMFDERFRPVVTQIEAELIAIVNMAFVKAGKDDIADVGLPYAMLDGVFRHLMQQQIEGPRKKRKHLQSIFEHLLGQFL